MNMQSPLAAESVTQASSPRPPLRQIRCLLPVWGHTFVRRFLEVGLPTWLADGNLPALARMLPTEFVLLTSRDDEMYLRAHPAFKRLSEVCRTSVHYVDHLITGKNYSTTITLAYAEAVRALGADMLDTCFLFLVSDYIVADGSFRSAVERVRAGRSGVLVGNFQVVEEDAMPWLMHTLHRTPSVLELNARELLGWAFSHLHPATVANTVNQPISHNEHTNRLFWRVDNRTLIGRFYLMHMIAIRPELTDFVIAASCDYSFIPEMCPSDNVEIITDSDEYLVIELQPRGHEADSVRPGPQRSEKLARSLSEWTTARHRKNVATTVVYHAGDVPAALQPVKAEADAFVAEVAKKLSRRPVPHRSHPYWKGAIAAFREASGIPLTADEQRLALGYVSPQLNENRFARRMLGWLQNALLGRPPEVRAWHPHHPDLSLVLTTLRELGLGEHARLLLLADQPTIFTTALPDGGERVVRIRATHLMNQPYEIYEPLHGKFDACLVEIGSRDGIALGELLDRVAPMMRDEGTVLVSVLDQGRGGDARQVQNVVARHASALVKPSARSASVSYVTSPEMRRNVLLRMLNLARRIRHRPRTGFPRALILGPPLVVIGTVANWLSSIRLNAPPKGYASSALIRIAIDAAAAANTHRYSSSRIHKAERRARLGLPEDHRVSQWPEVGKALANDYLLTGSGAPGGRTRETPVDEQESDNSLMEKTTETPSATREPQYNRGVEIRDRQGLTPLGLMTNQVWEDDPRRLAFLLSRYKFVSKMLAGKKFVGELGCGDAFGTRIVMQSVERVVAYDFDPVFIEDIRTRRSERWPVEAHVHDILDGPLPNTHDGIYSLDVIEHIARSDEHRYLSNLKSSMTDDSVLIIGSPSLESQPYASPPSKAGHVNCKSGAEFKSLLDKYFYNVFLFSMNDEVVHTGFAPMAHYLIAMCCQKK